MNAHEQGGFRCVAEPFGTNPRAAHTLSATREVYAWVFCRHKQSGELMPIAVRIHAPVEVRGGDDDTDTTKVFPPYARYWANHQPKAINKIAGSLH